MSKLVWSVLGGPVQQPFCCRRRQTVPRQNRQRRKPSGNCGERSSFSWLFSFSVMLYQILFVFWNGQRILCPVHQAPSLSVPGNGFSALLRCPASASCLGRHSRLADRCAKNCSLYSPFCHLRDIFPRSGGSRSSQGELLRICRSALIKFPLGEQTERVEPILLSSLYIPTKKRYSFSRTNFPGRRPWISASCTTFWYCAKK